MVKTRVLAAMSGGVDSSVAAALLLEQGFEVIGATMDLFAVPNNSAVASARNVAALLGIEHHTFNLSKLFTAKVIDEFINEYACGRTPNPCVNCNEHLKFGALLSEAEKLGCTHIATGHYVRSENKGSTVYLKKAANLKKDQSYFLYRLKQNVLAKTIFPLGDMSSKEEVKQLARKFALPVADKAESQDICFIPGNDSRDFILKRKPSLRQKGAVILAATGEILGQHEGIAFYTVGQRKGLGIAYKQPLYITGIDAPNNTIIVDTHGKLFSCTTFAEALTFAGKTPKQGEQLVVKAKIRYAHQEELATLTMLKDDFAEITFPQPQRAITPGQSIVFYDNELVLGGGIIVKSI